MSHREVGHKSAKNNCHYLNGSLDQTKKQLLSDMYSLFYLQSSLVIRSVSFKPDDGVDEDESGEGRKSGSDDGQCFGPTIGKEFAKEVVRLVEDANFRIHP